MGACVSLIVATTSAISILDHTQLDINQKGLQLLEINFTYLHRELCSVIHFQVFPVTCLTDDLRVYPETGLTLRVKMFHNHH